jgi:hypothetical protein
MAIAFGNRLGSYEILALLGAGGMARSTVPETSSSVARLR